MQLEIVQMGMHKKELRKLDVRRALIFALLISTDTMLLVEETIKKVIVISKYYVYTYLLLSFYCVSKCELLSDAFFSKNAVIRCLQSRHNSARRRLGYVRLLSAARKIKRKYILSTLKLCIR